MDFVKHTIELALKNVENCRRPSACATARDGEILAESLNRLVARTHDPTADAEGRPTNPNPYHTPMAAAVWL